jgi:hypothetical protein
MRRKKPTPPSPTDPSDEAPTEGDELDPDELDGDASLQLDDESWEALLPDDDYEPLPEYGDFWTD